MAKPSDDQRIPFTLRLPPELHQKLTLAAGSGKSLNAEILQRLARSFDTVEAKVAELDEWSTDHQRRIEDLESRYWELMERIGAFDPNGWKD